MSRNGEGRNEARDRIRELIGGYATGTLTDAERSLLMRAALEDQDLFDELMREQDLKTLLETPGARPRLMQAVTPQKRRSVWLWGTAAGLAAAALIMMLLPRGPEPVQLAKIEEAPAAESPAPQPAPPAGDAAGTRAAPAARPVPPPAKTSAPPPAPPPAAKEERFEAPPEPARQTPAPVAAATPAPAPPAAPEPEFANAPPPPPPKPQAPPAAPKALAITPAVAGSTVTGTVTDQAGARIADVPIVARNLATGSQFVAASSATGNYALPNLPPGQYQLQATQQGFRQFQTAFAATPQQTQRLDITLEVGAAVESVTVQAETARLRTETAPVADNVTKQPLSQLPVLGVGAAKGKAGGKGGAPGPAALARADATDAFGLTYALTGRSLRLTPLAAGYLFVSVQTSAGPVTLFPRNPVVPSTPIVLQIGDQATEVTVAFSAAPAIAPAEARRLADLGGTVTGTPSEELRFVLRVP